MPEQSVTAEAIVLVNSKKTDIRISISYSEGDCVHIQLTCIRNSQSNNIFPCFVFCFGIIRAHEHNLCRTVVVCISRYPVEFAIANQAFHAGNLKVMIVTIAPCHVRLLILTMPAGMPEGIICTVNQILEVLSFIRITIGTAQLVYRCNLSCSDIVLGSCESVENLSTQLVVHVNKNVMILEVIETSEESRHFVFSHWLKIPFAGPIVACISSVISSDPEL